MSETVSNIEYLLKLAENPPASGSLPGGRVAKTDQQNADVFSNHES